MKIYAIGRREIGRFCLVIFVADRVSFSLQYEMPLWCLKLTLSSTEMSSTAVNMSHLECSEEGQAQVNGFSHFSAP